MKPGLGDVIADKYRLDRVLGEGGMGTVYGAVNIVTGKQVAIKWLRPDLSRGEEYPARFIREAQVASRIDHPNVVNVFDVGRHEGALFLVMECLQGEPLSELFARGPQHPVELLRLMMPVFRGVHAAHRMGVVHRDLKPDNIFLCRGPHGDAREPKVLDFGISKVIEELDALRPLTRDGAVFGTPQYMAPEQLRNARAADARSDVYALAVILYRGLSGRFPYDADALPALALRIVEGQATHLGDLCHDVDPDLADVVMRALHVEADRRFQSVSALAVALEPYAEGVKFAAPFAAWSSEGDFRPGLTAATPGSQPFRERTPRSSRRDPTPASGRTPASGPEHEPAQRASQGEPLRVGAGPSPTPARMPERRLRRTALVALALALALAIPSWLWLSRGKQISLRAPAPPTLAAPRPVAELPSSAASDLPGASAELGVSAPVMRPSAPLPEQTPSTSLLRSRAEPRASTERAGAAPATFERPTAARDGAQRAAVVQQPARALNASHARDSGEQRLAPPPEAPAEGSESARAPAAPTPVERSRLTESDGNPYLRR